MVKDVTVIRNILVNGSKYQSQSNLLLAVGSGETLNDTKVEENLSGCDALLEELRDFHERYPDDYAVRERLSLGLVAAQLRRLKPGADA